MDDARAADGGEFFASHLRSLSAVALTAAGDLAESVALYATWARDTLAGGGRLLYCGNGGSAATAEHVAAEYAVRFRRRRRPLPALALTLGSAALTASANDFGFEEVFARALRAHARPGDLLVLHSTSGRSENLLRAARAATALSLRSVALLGPGAGLLGEEVDLSIRVPADSPAHVQEIHLAIEHAVANCLDSWNATDPDEADVGP